MSQFLLLNEILLVLSAGLLFAGFAVEMHPMLTQSRPKPAALAARGLLWAGTASVWISAWINWRHDRSVILDRTLSESDFLGMWIAGVFTVVSGWRAFSGRRANALLALVWFAGLCVLGIYIKEIFLPTY